MRAVKRMIAGVIVIGTTLFCLPWFRGVAPIEPVPENPFVTSCELKRGEDGALVDETIVIPQDTEGFYGYLDITVTDDFPNEYEGHPVQHPDAWGVELNFYKRKSYPKTKGLLSKPAMPFKKGTGFSERISEREFPLPGKSGVIVGNSNPYARVGGPTREFKISPPEKLVENHLYRWTFCGVRDEPPDDEYVYEVAIYPTGYWKSSIRYLKGPPVVIKRGLVSYQNATIPAS